MSPSRTSSGGAASLSSARKRVVSKHWGHALLWTPRSACMYVYIYIYVYMQLSFVFVYVCVCVSYVKNHVTHIYIYICGTPPPKDLHIYIYIYIYTSAVYKGAIPGTTSPHQNTQQLACQHVSAQAQNGEPQNSEAWCWFTFGFPAKQLNALSVTCHFSLFFSHPIRSVIISSESVLQYQCSSNIKVRIINAMSIMSININMAVARKPIPKWNHGRWKRGPKPA